MYVLSRTSSEVSLMEILRRTESGGYEGSERRSIDSPKVRRCQRSFSNSLPPSSLFRPPSFFCLRPPSFTFSLSLGSPRCLKPAFSRQPHRVPLWVKVSSYFLRLLMRVNPINEGLILTPPDRGVYNAVRASLSGGSPLNFCGS